MSSRSYQKFAIVQGDSAQSLTDQLNEQLYKLRDKHPVVTFEGMIARICYDEVDYDPEPEDEEPKIEIFCQDCPYFVPLLKAVSSYCVCAAHDLELVIQCQIVSLVKTLHI